MLRVDGHLDALTAHLVYRVLSALGTAVALDLTDITACDPDALRILVAVSETCRRRDGAPLVLSAGAVAAPALERAGVGDRFTHTETMRPAGSAAGDGG